MSPEMTALVSSAAKAFLGPIPKDALSRGSPKVHALVTFLWKANGCWVLDRVSEL